MFKDKGTKHKSKDRVDHTVKLDGKGKMFTCNDGKTLLLDRHKGYRGYGSLGGDNQTSQYSKNCYQNCMNIAGISIPT
jgi:hypothetical protein